MLKAYHLWRPLLDDRPFCILAYMALRARDNDAAPWYGAGHDELAAVGLGLPMGTEHDRQNGIRAVRRAMTALHAAGAVTTHRYARPGKHATYLLWLDTPAAVDNRRKRRTPTVLRTPENVGRSATYEHPNVGRSVAKRRTLSDLQRSKEEEVMHERTSPEANLLGGEVWKAPRLRAVDDQDDPWAEDARRARRNGQASP